MWFKCISYSFDVAFHMYVLSKQDVSMLDSLRQSAESK